MDRLTVRRGPWAPAPTRLQPHPVRINHASHPRQNIETPGVVGPPDVILRARLGRLRRHILVPVIAVQHRRHPECIRSRLVDSTSSIPGMLPFTCPPAIATMNRGVGTRQNRSTSKQNTLTNRPPTNLGRLQANLRGKKPAYPPLYVLCLSSHLLTSAIEEDLFVCSQ